MSDRFCSFGSPALLTALCFVLMASVDPPPVQAQIGQAAAEFQILQPHPYIHALGNATVAARGYPGAVGINPATIGGEGTVQVGSNVNLSQGPLLSSPWFFSDFWMTAPSAAVKMGRWSGAVQVKHFAQGTIEMRDSEGRSLESIDQFEQSIKVAGAFDVSPSLTVGAGVNLIRLQRRTQTIASTGETEDTHVTLDLGLHYGWKVQRNAMTLQPAFGVSITDIGSTFSFEDIPGTRGAPMTFRGGGAFEVTSAAMRYGRPEWRIGLYGAFSNLLVSGDTVVDEFGRERFEADGPFTALIEGWGTTQGELTANGRAEVGPWERLNKHVGLEMAVLDVLSVRLGRFHEADDNGARQYTSLGFGLDAYYVALDASWALGEEAPVQTLSFGRLTVRIPLSNSNRNFWPDLF